ncbi:DUF1830 domain-containing protein [Neosynechococcus sphagnicola]|uniref:DUF1830 domain-containing protein n=1 Tax=Neosynechococcus sphagnicola TaxID=1501145 RepID=UPI00055BD154|nr:DUF1830 domain-containing protein [Neosynechococcus sphagnicola]
MSQTFTPPLPRFTDGILCYYENVTTEVQLASIVNIPNWHFQRIVFPRERLLLEVPADALLDVYGATEDSQETLLEQIPCQRLQVREENPSGDGWESTQTG